MRVLLINGSPNAHGCTETALLEVEKTLKEEGVEVVYLPRTPEISSTQIKQDLHK